MSNNPITRLGIRFRNAGHFNWFACTLMMVAVTSVTNVFFPGPALLCLATMFFMVSVIAWKHTGGRIEKEGFTPTCIIWNGFLGLLCLTIRYLPALLPN